MTKLPEIKFCRVEANLNADIPLPRYATPGAAGFDFAAAIKEPVSLSPGEQAIIPTGLKVAIPEGYELQIRPRSGLAFKNRITVTNSPGTIDSDYRGEIMIMLINLSDKEFVVSRGDRVAQGVVAAAPQFSIIEVNDLDDTERGDGGFGSTGR